GCREPFASVSSEPATPFPLWRQFGHRRLEIAIAALADVAALQCDGYIGQNRLVAIVGAVGTPQPKDGHGDRPAVRRSKVSPPRKAPAVGRPMNFASVLSRMNHAKPSAALPVSSPVSTITGALYRSSPTSSVQKAAAPPCSPTTWNTPASV